MSSAEYLAITAGLITVWQGVEQVIYWLTVHEERLLWSLSIPL